MTFITKEDFKSHLKDYIIDAISDNDDEILNEAIARAMTEATEYLDRFDTDAIFATTGEDRKKYANLIGYIKDIAKWYFVSLSNLLTNWDVAEVTYKNAIASLSKIQSGKSTPKGWPFPEETETINTPFLITSRPKRGNYI